MSFSFKNIMNYTASVFDFFSGQAPNTMTIPNMYSGNPNNALIFVLQVFFIVSNCDLQIFSTKNLLKDLILSDSLEKV